METGKFRPGTFIEAGAYWALVLNDNQNLLGKCMLFLNRKEKDVARVTFEEWLPLRANLASARARLMALSTRILASETSSIPNSDPCSIRANRCSMTPTLS